MTEMVGDCEIDDVKLVEELTDREVELETLVEGVSDLEGL